MILQAGVCFLKKRISTHFVDSPCLSSNLGSEQLLTGFLLSVARARLEYSAGSSRPSAERSSASKFSA